MEDGLYGFVDSTGSVVITPQYKYVSRFNQYGYAAVITDYSLRIEKGKFGIADTLLHIKYGIIKILFQSLIHSLINKIMLLLTQYIQ